MSAPKTPFDGNLARAGGAPAEPGPAARGDAAERFLRAIGKVLTDRTLYPSSHPQALAGMAALRNTIGELFVDSDQRTFVIIDDQIFVDDRLLGGRGKGTGELAVSLRERGVEVLSIKKGLTLEEAQSLVDVLAAPRTKNAEKPQFRSDHVVLGDIAIEDTGSTVVPGAVQDLGFAISRSSQQPQLNDAAKILRDTYIDWTTIQDVVLTHVERIMVTLEKSLYANFQSFIPLAELKAYDEYTHVHAINLSILTMAQAESLGFPKAAVHAFGLGALLHDVGKTKVSVDVLHKAGKLTPEEQEEMKTHPVHGAAQLLRHPEIPRVAAIVAYEHHLRFDRTGYPTLTRDRPQHIASRITAVSDHFDAMRSNRPYRDAMEPEQIFEIMQNNKGKDLDPVLVDHFFAFMKSRKT
jgi:HD-GYP domain-containing protein (c-di-GMP phosphodiesterase class II)